MGLVIFVFTFVDVLALLIWPFDDDRLNRVEVLVEFLVTALILAEVLDEVLVAVEDLVVDGDGISRVTAAACRQ